MQEVTDKMEVQIKKLKEEVRKMLLLPTKTLVEKMHLIDSIQRLGVSYHFEFEIDDELQQINDRYVENGKINMQEEDLHTLALLFRLLRQHGYYISPGMPQSPSLATSNHFVLTFILLHPIINIKLP